MLLAERLSSKPTESIPNACMGWAETQAAYRFLSNPRTDWQALLEPHWANSLERMRAFRWCSTSKTRRAWTSTLAKPQDWAR